MIILINGKKRSGKDWTAKLIKQDLEDRGYTADIRSFASPMKFIISQTFDITENELDLYKNDDDYGIELKVYPNNQPPCTIKYTDFRTILQRFGTEAMKPIFGNDIWAELLYKNAEKSEYDFILVPDFRFLVEYRDNAVTLKIKHTELESQCTDTHASETELNDFSFDYTIDNTGYPDTSVEIKQFCDTIIKKEKI